MLIAALLAFGMVALVMAIRLGSWFLAPAEVPPEPETLPAVGAYEFDGMWYVNAALPPEHWEDWIG